jgi:8-oxo-dGTP diphosphatase
VDVAAEAGSRKRYPMPFTRLEIAVLSLVDGELGVLLGRRASEPQKGRWALPGGVLRIDLDESLDAAARRVAAERLGKTHLSVKQLLAVGGPGRDPDRSPFTVSVVYRALVGAKQRDFFAGKRLDELAWRPAAEVMDDRRMAFDHAELVTRAVEVNRAEVRALDLNGGLVPETFTRGELQSMCEAVLGEALDKSSFRRRLSDRDLVEPVEGEMRAGPNRPAQIYRLRTLDSTRRHESVG